MRLKKRIAELNVLRNMEADMVRYEAAKRKMEETSGKHAASITGIFQEMLPENKADDLKESRKNFLPGWVIRQKEISVSDVSIGKMMEFVRRAESQAMPWCMTKCAIRSAPGSAGMGQVVMTLEVVEKAE